MESKTAEDFFDKHVFDDMWKEESIQAMQEFAAQQNKELVDKVIGELKDHKKFYDGEKDPYDLGYKLGIKWAIDLLTETLNENGK